MLGYASLVLDGMVCLVCGFDFVCFCSGVVLVGYMGGRCSEGGLFVVCV